MKSIKGLTVKERIDQEIMQLNNFKHEDNAFKNALIHKALGAVNFAAEFELITYDEWENYIDALFN